MHWPENGVASISRSRAFISSTCILRPERIEFTYRDEQAAFGTGGDLAGRTVEADGAFYSVVQLPHEAPAVGATAEPAEMTRTVAVGTVLGDALFAGLRRIAQEAESFRRFPAPPSATTTDEDC